MIRNVLSVFQLQKKHGTFYTIHRQTINGITHANDVAFGVEGSYFPSSQKRSRKSLDNMARVLAYLCNYWGIDYKTEVPGHQDIPKIDPETY